MENPGMTMACALAWLPAAIWLYGHRAKVGAVIVLLPVSPLLLLRLCGAGVVWLCDMCVRGRWAEPLRCAVDELTEGWEHGNS